jgi:hypothetical protein
MDLKAYPAMNGTGGGQVRLLKEADQLLQSAAKSGVVLALKTIAMRAGESHPEILGPLLDRHGSKFDSAQAHVAQHAVQDWLHDLPAEAVPTKRGNPPASTIPDSLRPAVPPRMPEIVAPKPQRLTDLNEFLAQQDQLEASLSTPPAGDPDSGWPGMAQAMEESLKASSPSSGQISSSAHGTKPRESIPRSRGFRSGPPSGTEQGRRSGDGGTSRSPASKLPTPGGSAVLERLAADLSLGEMEWLHDKHVEFYGKMLHADLTRTNPGLAAQIRFVEPSEALMLRAGDAELAKDFLQEWRTSPYLFVPVNDGGGTSEGSHWSLLFVDRRRPDAPQFLHYNSLPGPGHSKVAQEIAAKIGNGNVTSAPMARQPNNYDCGVFMLSGIHRLTDRLAHGGIPMGTVPSLQALRPKRADVQNALGDIQVDLLQQATTP